MYSDPEIASKLNLKFKIGYLQCGHIVYINVVTVL